MHNGLASRAKAKERAFQASMLRGVKSDLLREACLSYVDRGVTSIEQMPKVQELLNGNRIGRIPELMPRGNR